MAHEYNYFKNVITNGRLQTQQPIMYNAQVDMDLGTWRRQTIEDKTIPDNRKFTTTLTSGRGDQFDLLHIRNLEPAFYYNHQSKTLPTDTYYESRVKIVQNLNGLEIPENVRTQEQFEDMFIFGGQPMRDFFFGKSGQPPNGVTMLRAGSKGAWNYGHDVWYPGDKLVYRMPHIDPQLREQERERLPKDMEHHAMRDRAIIEVLNFDDSHNFLRKALTNSFDERRKYNNSFLRILPESADSVSATDNAVISLRNFLQFHSLSTIAVMLAYGLVPQMVPGMGPNGEVVQSDLMAPENYNANSALENKDFNDILKMMPERGRGDANFGKLAVPVREKTQAETEANGKLVTYWAAKLGLAGTSERGSNKPFYNFIDLTLGMTLRALLVDEQAANYFSIMRFFPASMKQGATVRNPRSGDLSINFDLNHPVGALAYCQSSFAKRLFATCGRAAEKKANKTMFISLERTEPGQWGDTYW